jgi:hypothetical protein
MAVFWVVAPCSLVEVYQRFRGPCSLHHQGDRPEWEYGVLSLFTTECRFHTKYGIDLWRIIFMCFRMQVLYKTWNTAYLFSPVTNASSIQNEEQGVFVVTCSRTRLPYKTRNAAYMFSSARECSLHRSGTDHVLICAFTLY